MILWQTAQRWTYKGRKCEIQRTNVEEATQYRGLVEVETGLSDGALEAAPVAGLRRRNRPERHGDEEFREWVSFNWSDEDGAVSLLREEVNGLAEHVRDGDV